MDWLRAGLELEQQPRGPQTSHKLMLAAWQRVLPGGTRGQ